MQNCVTFALFFADYRLPLNDQCGTSIFTSAIDEKLKNRSNFMPEYEDYDDR